jgi:Transglycosylase SLT domain
VLARVCASLVLLLPACAAWGETPHLTTSALADESACRVVEGAANFAGVPVEILTRLVWTESRFRPDVISEAGAQGIAQFMPATAAERGLVDPFDSDQAILGAAELLADLDLRFGNIGLAVAAYNAGPNRVQSWLAGTGQLPAETQAYVQAVTGRAAESWAGDRHNTNRLEHSADGTCLDVTASLRATEGGRSFALPSPFERGFLEAIAVSSFERARQRHCRRLESERPIITGTMAPSGHIILAGKPASAIPWSRDGEISGDPVLPSFCTVNPRLKIGAPIPGRPPVRHGPPDG